MDRNRSRNDRDDDEPVRRRSSRDEEPARSSRSRDDDDRGGRGRERSSRDDDDRDERPARGRSRDDDDDRGGRSMRDAGRSGGFRYEPRSAESLKKRADRGARDFDSIFVDGTPVYKVNDGDNTVRFLPPTWTDPKPDHYGFDVWVHYQVGPDKQSYLCLSKMLGKPCPVCEERIVALDDGDENYAKELAPRRRVVAYILDREEPKEGAQAFAMAQTLDRDIVAITVDKKTGEALPIDDPENGYDVDFTKKGTKMNTEYLGVAIARRESALGSNKAMEYAIAHPIPDILNYYDYDHIKKTFGGGGGSAPARRNDRDDERDDDRPARGRSSSRDDDEPPRRGGRDRDREDEPSGRRSSSRDDSDGPSRRRSSRDEEPELDWTSIHAMTGPELEAIVESKRLKINPNKAESDDELADWICADLDLAKPSGRRAARDEPADEGSSRLSEMRRNRERD